MSPVKPESEDFLFWDPEEIWCYPLPPRSEQRRCEGDGTADTSRTLGLPGREEDRD